MVKAEKHATSKFRPTDIFFLFVKYAIANNRFVVSNPNQARKPVPFESHFLLTFMEHEKTGIKERRIPYRSNMKKWKRICVLRFTRQILFIVQSRSDPHRKSKWGILI